MRVVTSMYWNNISPKIVAEQKAAFSALGYDMVQCEATGTPHGAWMDKVLAAAGADDLILFVDIDCIPLNAAIVERAFAAAGAGRVLGTAHTANHLGHPDFIYAGPMFLCFAKKTWDQAGRVSMLEVGEFDVAQAFNKALQDRNIPIDLVWPGFVCRPLWPLSNKGTTGIATFYEGDIFHLFQSRIDQGYDYAFHYVADCVVRGRRIDYAALNRKMHSLGIYLENKRAHWRQSKLRRRLRSWVGLRTHAHLRMA